MGRQLGIIKLQEEIELLPLTRYKNQFKLS